MSLSESSRRWLTGVALTLVAISAQAGNLAVTAAFAPDGSLWRLRVDGGQLQLDRSADLGRSFSTPVAIGAVRSIVSGSAQPRAPA